MYYYYYYYYYYYLKIYCFVILPRGAPKHIRYRCITGLKLQVCWEESQIPMQFYSTSACEGCRTGQKSLPVGGGRNGRSFQLTDIARVLDIAGGYTRVPTTKPSHVTSVKDG
jgi:hypothetical protein